MCHRRVWKAHWQIPDVTRPELKVRERPIFFLTLHVGKTGSSETGKGSSETGSGKCHRGAGTTAIIARRRPLPSETFRFAPSRRSSLRSFRVLATLSLAPALHAVPSPTHSHGHGRPWVSRGHSLPPASPTTAPACLADDRARLPRQHHTPPPHRQDKKAGAEGKSGRQDRKDKTTQKGPESGT